MGHFNKPIGKIRNTPFCWARKYHKPWYCGECIRSFQGTENVLRYELFARIAAKKVAATPRVHVLCGVCVEKVLSQCLESVKLLNAHGVDGFLLQERL